MVRSGEGTLTEMALERPVPRVLAIVAGELVRAGKLPPTSLPVAAIGFFSSVGAQVGLEMTRLGVGFVTAGVGTGMCRLSLSAPRSSAPLLRNSDGGGIHRQEKFD